MLMKAEKEEDPKLLELPAYLLIEVSTEIGQVQSTDKKKTTQTDQK
jgi:hypothetical protein